MTKLWRPVRIRSQIKSQRGFTLIELIMAIVILGIIGAVSTTFFVSTFSTASNLAEEQLHMGSARYALERVRRELREVAFDRDTQSALITSMSASQITWTQSGLSQNFSTVLDYSGTSLSLGYPPSASEALLQNVSALQFTYLDINRAVTATPALVRHIQISLTVSATDIPSTTLQTEVSLRNP